MKTKKPDELATEQFELFLPYLADLPLRDQREMMERPFFSLAKSKRQKPIDYRSPDNKLWVHVSANPDYGMATIWDADILIYCASVLADLARRGHNDIPRKLRLMPYDLLRAIGRPTTGRAYELLGQALDRLVATTVKTNIRAENRREATFSWLDGWSQLVDERTERSRGMTIELSNWFYEGVLMTGGVLSIDRAYFDITGGRERWLYKVARKHAGGAGTTGFAISMPTLFEKSGAEGQYRRFKFELLKIIERNMLPGYALSTEVGRGEPLVRMRRRDDADQLPTSSTVHGLREALLPSAHDPLILPEAATADFDTDIIPPASAEAHLQADPSDVAALLKRATSRIAMKARETSQSMRTELALECPGWDLDALEAEFRNWIDKDPSRLPVNYDKAFAGFVRRWHAKNNR